MAKLYSLHPSNPQSRIIEVIVKDLKQGALMLYPTDTVYAIGCDFNHKSAVQRVKQLKHLFNDEYLTCLCSSLSKIADYAFVSDKAYRLMKRVIPGPYTFLLPGTKLVSKLMMNTKQKDIGIRVPDNNICQMISESLDNPIVSSSVRSLDKQREYTDIALEKAMLFDIFDSQVDLIIDNGLESEFELSTILDMTSDNPIVVRQGLGWDELQNRITLIG
ncbi:MAG: L-threonylcarbamoyladenylate synthase [cyanobacterium endosymbiont of Rhopalodia sterrenbergii]